jgi:hypothetical protein
MFEALISFVFTVILRILVWIVAVPLGCLLMTPIVLVRAGSGSGSYREKVASGYKKILLWFLDSFLNQSD